MAANKGRSFKQIIKDAIYGNFGGMKANAPVEMAARCPFSDYLNYIAYDPDRKLYINRDATVGFLWECSPSAFASVKQAEMLEGLFRAGLPDGTAIQFTLYSDKHVENIIDAYHSYRSVDNPLVHAYTKSVMNFVRTGTQGLDNLTGIPSETLGFL
jgi:conjugal transfer ATP-binding protein TraC